MLLPARVRFTNLDWTKGEDEALVRAASAGRDVLLGCEGRDGRNRPVPVRRILGADWLVFHDEAGGDPDTLGARAGSFVAIRRDWLPDDAEVIDHGLTRISGGGDGVQARYLRDVEVRVPGRRPLHLLAWHLPLEQTGKQADAAAAVRRHIERIRSRGHDFVGGADVNQPPLLFAARAWVAGRGQKRWGIFHSWRLGSSVLDLAYSARHFRRTDTPFLDVVLSDTDTRPTPRPGRGRPRRPASRPRRRPRRRRRARARR